MTFGGPVKLSAQHSAHTHTHTFYTNLFRSLTDQKVIIKPESSHIAITLITIIKHIPYVCLIVHILCKRGDLNHMYIYLYCTVDKLSPTSIPQMQIGSEYKDTRGTNFGIFILIWVLGNVFISYYDKSKTARLISSFILW